MNRAVLWKRLKNIIDSCITHEQCNVARNLIDLAAYDLMNNKDKKLNLKHGEVYQGEYYSDLSCRLTDKRRSIEDIEDLKLLEKMNAKDKDFKKPL